MSVLHLARPEVRALKPYSSARMEASGGKILLNANESPWPPLGVDGDLNRYSALIRTIAEKNSLPLVDLRKVFMDYSKANNPENKEKDILTTDRVHLNEKGNETVAAEMWKAIQSIK